MSGKHSLLGALDVGIFSMNEQTTTKYNMLIGGSSAFKAKVRDIAKIKYTQMAGTFFNLLWNWANDWTIDWLCKWLFHTKQTGKCKPQQSIKAEQTLRRKTCPYRRQITGGGVCGRTNIFIKSRACRLPQPHSTATESTSTTENLNQLYSGEPIPGDIF